MPEMCFVEASSNVTTLVVPGGSDPTKLIAKEEISSKRILWFLEEFKSPIR